MIGTLGGVALLNCPHNLVAHKLDKCSWSQSVLFTVVLFYIQQVVLFSTFPILLLSYYINGYRLRAHIIMDNSVNNLLRVPFSALSFIEKRQ